jgi:hypothetical protein
MAVTENGCWVIHILFKHYKIISKLNEAIHVEKQLVIYITRQPSTYFCFASTDSGRY